MRGDNAALGAGSHNAESYQEVRSASAELKTKEIKMTQSNTKGGVSRLSVFALGMSLGLFLSITFSLCIVFDLMFPHYAMHGAWHDLLPGFVWLSWGAFAIGLVETFLYGWYAALIFGPLYNLFAGR